MLASSKQDPAACSKCQPQDREQGQDELHACFISQRTGSAANSGAGQPASLNETLRTNMVDPAQQISCLFVLLDTELMRACHAARLALYGTVSDMQAHLKNSVLERSLPTPATSFSSTPTLRHAGWVKVAHSGGDTQGYEYHQR